MKSIYYKKLIADRMGLSASERIVFSFLVYVSVCSHDDAWDKDTGMFDAIQLKDVGEEIPMPHFFFKESGFRYESAMSKMTSINQSTISRAIKKFEKNGLIDLYSRKIYHQNIFDGGFFNLDNEHGLSGELKIFYSWLLDIRGNDKYIYANRQKLADLYHVNQKDIRDYLRRLKLLGLIERDSYKRLIIK